MPVPDLGNARRTIEVIRSHEFAFQKKFGQNFLIDPHVLGKIIDAAQIGPSDLVLEIGPGIGTLTQYLSQAAARVVAVEIDRGLIPVLSETLAGYDNVTVINEDVLKVDLEALISEYRPGCANPADAPGIAPGAVRVVANLPYYITTPILMNLLERKLPVASITVMVQKEVAERMQAAPGTKDYGALSLAVQYYAKPYLAANVPPNCFMPRPKVGSALIRLDRYEVPPVSVRDERYMFRLIRASFNQRRKTLVNSLRGDAGLELSREEIEAALSKMGLPATIRGEKLSLAEFAALSDALKSGPL